MGTQTLEKNALSATRTHNIRLLACVIAMVVAPWGFVVANGVYAWAIRNGGSDMTGAESLALFEAHPWESRISTLAAMLACILIIPAVLGLFRLAPGSRLVLVGGALMILGYIGYFGILTSGSTIAAMVELGGTRADFAAVLDAGQGDMWMAWIFILFVLGNLLGTALVAIGLLIGHVVSWWAASAILAWPVLHVVGLIFFTNEIPQVIGAVLQAIGLAACAAVLLRRDRVAQQTGRDGIASPPGSVTTAHVPTA